MPIRKIFTHAAPWLISAAIALAPLAAGAEKLRIAVLPAADAVLLYAAEDSGAFAAHGLEVTLKPFRSAIEVGAAMRAKELEGHYGDLMNVLTQNATGAPQAVVATMTQASPKARSFAFVTRPGSRLSALSDLKADAPAETAMSASTIIDYLLDRMSETAGVPQNALSRKEIRQIPIRLQLLLSGKIETALLPEPLCSLVEKKGGRALWDDRALNEPLAVVALRREALDPKTVSAFRAALSEAARAIEADPEKHRALMVKKRLLTKESAQGFTMPSYAHFGTPDGLPPLPEKKDVERVAKWMLAKKMISEVPAFEAVVYADKR